jgi:hypothetical protein
MPDYRREAAESVDSEQRLNQEIGAKVLAALLFRPLWVTRTVEAISFVDRHTVRRRLSRHYEIPRLGHRPSLPGTDLVRLPVFDVFKGQFLSCDLIDENKRYVSLPPLPERAHLSAIALRTLAVEIIGQADTRVEELITEFVTAGPESCMRKFDEAYEDKSMEALFANPFFDHLARRLAFNYVVFIDVPADPGAVPRRVIRFELDVRFPHKSRELREWREAAKERPGFRAPVWNARPAGPEKRMPRPVRRLLRRLGLMGSPYHHELAIDGAGSVHLDLEGTEGVAFGDRALLINTKRPPAFFRKERGVSPRRARLLIPRTKGTGEALVSLNLRPAPGLLRTGAPLLLLGFAALLWGSAAHYDELAGKPAAVSLLLLLPGLVSIVTARPGEHPYVTSALLGVRVLAIVPVPLGILSAYILLTKGNSSILVVEAIVSALAGSVLLLGRIIDEFKLRPRCVEFVDDDLTRIG